MPWNLVENSNIWWQCKTNDKTEACFKQIYSRWNNTLWAVLLNAAFSQTIDDVVPDCRSGKFFLRRDWKLKREGEKKIDKKGLLLCAIICSFLFEMKSQITHTRNADTFLCFVLSSVSVQLQLIFNSSLNRKINQHLFSSKAIRMQFLSASHSGNLNWKVENLRPGENHFDFQLD